MHFLSEHRRRAGGRGLKVNRWWCLPLEHNCRKQTDPGTLPFKGGWVHSALCDLCVNFHWLFWNVEFVLPSNVSLHNSFFITKVGGICGIRCHLSVRLACDRVFKYLFWKFWFFLQRQKASPCTICCTNYACKYMGLIKVVCILQWTNKVWYSSWCLSTAAFYYLD